MSKRGAIGAIKPLHPDLIPPEGAEPAGFTTLDGTGKQVQVYKMKRPTVVTAVKLNKEGEEVWRTNPLTGEPLTRVRKVVGVEWNDYLFYLQSQGNGNIEKMPFIMPTPAELAEQVRRAKIEDMKDTLAAKLVDAGVDIDALLEGLKPKPAEAPAPAASAPASAPTVDGEPEAGNEELPEIVPVAKHITGGKKWRLSDGSVVDDMTKEQALEADRALQQAARDVKAEADLVPTT